MKTLKCYPLARNHFLHSLEEERNVWHAMLRCVAEETLINQWNFSPDLSLAAGRLGFRVRNTIHSGIELRPRRANASACLNPPFSAI